MKFYKHSGIILGVIFIISVLFSSCASGKREAVCKGNYTQKNYNSKKNKSRYNQKYASKSKSVRKDYVIKNGIAH